MCLYYCILILVERDAEQSMKTCFCYFMKTPEMLFLTNIEFSPFHLEIRQTLYEYH